MNNHKKILTFSLILNLILVMVITGVVIHKRAHFMGMIKSVVGSKNETSVNSSYLKAITEILNPDQFTHKRDLIDKVRNFVFLNSVHINDAEHREYAFNTPVVLEKIIAHHRGQGTPPHLTCGPRSLAMRSILNHLGIESRLVHVFTDDFDTVASHTFLDVLDPDTGKWESQDPDNNIYFVHKDTGQRLSSLDLVLHPLGNAIPRSDKADGWAENNAQIYGDHYYEAVAYPFSGTILDPVIIVNTDRFSMDKRFTKIDNVNFNEFATKRYPIPRVILGSTLH